MKGVLPSLVRCARCAGTRLVGPVQNIFFPTTHYFSSFVPITQKDRQAVVPGRLSLNVCL